MSQVHGGRLVVKTLSELGVRDIFSLSGGHINPIYDACGDFGIRLIDTHHEQGAAMAADAYGRVKREPGVCLVTAGPGFTNALTGIAGAFMSNSPCLFLAGKTGIEESDRLPLQEIDQQAMITPITKWARTVYDAHRLPEYIASAYKRAISGRPGPVYLGMPHEILYESVSEGDVYRYNVKAPYSKSEAPSEAASEALDLIMSARRPVLIAGSGAWYSGADGEILRFIERAEMPLFTLNFGRGIVSDKHPLCFGAASPGAPSGFKRATSEADLIILLGIRLSLYIGWGRTFNPEAKVIQVDIDPSEIGRNRPADLGIAADISKTLSRLTEGLEKRQVRLNFQRWTARIRAWRDEEWGQMVEGAATSDRVPMHALRVIRAVEEVMDADGMLVIDGGDTQAFCDSAYQVQKPGHYVKGGPLGCMGVGVPFAIGTKAAYPSRQVCLITGDGAVGMNFMEFETAIRHKLPFVAVVCNDQGWGMTKHQLWLSYGRDKKTAGVDLPFTPFHEIVKALGGYGETVSGPRELRGAIERAFSAGVAALINVPTDPEAISPATYALTQMMTPKHR
ncbi:MAG: thiamine pyrophosphate-binding protein [Deltaproteobacteria bacterium]